MLFTIKQQHRYVSNKYFKNRIHSEIFPKWSSTSRCRADSSDITHQSENCVENKCCLEHSKHKPPRLAKIKETNENWLLNVYNIIMVVSNHKRKKIVGQYLASTRSLCCVCVLYVCSMTSFVVAGTVNKISQRQSIIFAWTDSIFNCPIYKSALLLRVNLIAHDALLVNQSIPTCQGLS